MRFENWPELLAAFIEARRHTPFKWGESDCCLFAADALLAMTGVDVAAHNRGKYDTARGALALIKEAGGVSGLVALEPVDRKLASRGDIVMVDTAQGDALGVLLGRTVAAQGADGLVFLPPSAIEQAWKGVA